MATPPLNAERYEPSMAEMLRRLVDDGWKPVLYVDDGSQTSQGRTPWAVAVWIAYPMGEVRYWKSFRAPDPVGAVRSLYLHALEHPNRPPSAPAVEAAGAPGPAPTAAAVIEPAASDPGAEESLPHEIARGVLALACVVMLSALAMLVGGP